MSGVGAQRGTCAVTGTFQVGKSSIVNCLLGQRLGQTGSGWSTTHAVTKFIYGTPPGAKVTLRNGHIRRMSLDAFERQNHLLEFDSALVTIRNNLLQNLDLLDTPGVSAAGEQGAEDDRLANDACESADLLIVVMPNQQLSQPLLNRFRAMLTRRPFVVLMNCILNSNPNPKAEHNTTVAGTIETQLAMSALKPVAMPNCPRVLPVNAVWDLVASGLVDNEPAERAERLIDQVHSWYRLRRVPVPDNFELRRFGGLDPVRQFMYRDHWFIGQAPDVAEFWRAVRNWADPVRTAAARIH